MSTEDSDFSCYIIELRKIYTKYESFAYNSDRIERDNAIKAEPEVKAILHSIDARISSDMSFTAKQNALSAIIEVSGEIYKQGDRCGHGKDIRKDMPWLGISDLVEHALDVLLPEELAALQADGEAGRDLSNLQWRVEDLAMDLGLKPAVARLWLEESDQEDDNL